METEPIVTIETGKIKGKLSTDFLGGKYYAFLGIPYAKPPIGSLRFKEPEPAEAWSGIRDATKNGNECPSFQILHLGLYAGEESSCLNLNVFTPQLPQENTKPLPVMVFIHGGAFVTGSNKTELFGGGYLVTGDVVLVVPNYRLGAFGFLALEDDSLDVPGNAGMKDVVLALKWVQDNIWRFNGDPNNVTIFGQSAGSATVHLLILSPKTDGLFHKAIMQSGCALNHWAKGSFNGVKMGEKLGLEFKDERELLEKLRKLPARTLADFSFENFPAITSSEKTVEFAPVVENPSNPNAFITEDPWLIMKSGNFKKIPMIIGYTSLEGIFYEIDKNFRNKLAFKGDFHKDICFRLQLDYGSSKASQKAQELEKYYFDDQYHPSKAQQIYTMASDTTIVYGVQKSIEYFNAHKVSPIYIYRMNLHTSRNIMTRILTTPYKWLLKLMFISSNTVRQFSLISHVVAIFQKNLLRYIVDMFGNDQPDGVAHSDELFYLFETQIHHRIKPDSIEDKSVKMFVKFWTNFAKYGNPTPDGEWKCVDGNELNYLEIDDELSTGTSPDWDRKKFWDSLHEIIGD